MYKAILVIVIVGFITFRIIRSKRLRQQRKENLQRAIREFNERWFNESE